MIDLTALHLNLIIPDIAPISLPCQTIDYIPKSILIDISDDIMNQIINYVFKLKVYKEDIENDNNDIDDDSSDEKPHQDDESDDDPNSILKISASITHILVEDDVKYVISKRSSIAENNWFRIHHIMIRGSYIFLFFLLYNTNIFFF
jgi:hypothetical protein